MTVDPELLGELLDQRLGIWRVQPHPTRPRPRQPVVLDGATSEISGNYVVTRDIAVAPASGAADLPADPPGALRL